MSFNRWEEFSSIYQKLLSESCLCNVETFCIVLQLWHEIYESTVKPEKYDGFSEEECMNLQLLSLTILKMIGEKKIQTISCGEYVCRHLCSITEDIEKTDLFNKLMKCLLISDSKILKRAIMKALASIYYQLPPHSASSNVEQLLKITLSEKLVSERTDIISLLLLILQYKVSKNHNCSPDLKILWEQFQSACKAKVKENIFIIDRRNHCCTQIACYWNEFVKAVFDCNQSSILAEFLRLWKVINEVVLKNEDKNLCCVFLNLKFIPDFFYCAAKMDIYSLREFTDVAIQIVINDMNDNLIRGMHLSEEKLADLICDNFLRNIDLSDTAHYIVLKNSERIKESYLISTTKASEITLRKVVVVILKIITEMKNESLLQKILCETEGFLHKKINMNEAPVYVWIINLFFEQDDLLFNALFATLTVYLNLESKYTVGEQYSNSNLKSLLNPHKTFILFLLKLGYDHHIILTFLMSNETCFLKYFLCYLKLIITEWTYFIRAHDELKQMNTFLHTNSDKQLNHATCDTADNSVTKSIIDDMSSAKNIQLEQKVDHMDDEKQSDIHSHSKEFNVKQVFCEWQLSVEIDVYLTVSALRKLRESIEKHMARNEFPYNAQPLLKLIKNCEIKYTL